MPKNFLASWTMAAPNAGVFAALLVWGLSFAGIDLTEADALALIDQILLFIKTGEGIATIVVSWVTVFLGRQKAAETGTPLTILPRRS